MLLKKVLIPLLFFRKKININETIIIKRPIRAILSFIKYNMFVLKKDTTITWYWRAQTVIKIINDHDGSIKFINHKNGAEVKISLPKK